jgi:hypothetical protein
LRNYSGGRARSETFSAIQETDGITKTDGNISPENTFFQPSCKILKVLRGKNLHPGIWLWAWISDFAGMTLLNLD